MSVVNFIDAVDTADDPRSGYGTMMGIARFEFEEDDVYSSPPAMKEQKSSSLKSGKSKGPKTSAKVSAKYPEQKRAAEKPSVAKSAPAVSTRVMVKSTRNPLYAIAKGIDPSAPKRPRGRPKGSKSGGPSVAAGGAIGAMLRDPRRRDPKIELSEQLKSVIHEMVFHPKFVDMVDINVLLAKKTGYNYRYLSRIFSLIEHKTVERFIIEQKIARVKEWLLEEGRHVLADIAFELNYSSVAHLSSQFKMIEGITVREFRNKHRLKDLSSTGDEMSELD